MAGPLGIPLGVLTDSYKACHFAVYPESKKAVAYGEFRAGFNGDKEDTRLVFYGIRFIIENYIAKKWTKEDVALAAKFYETHNAGMTPYPFPKDLFEQFIDEYDGYFPVKIEALPEGTACHVHTPVYQITAEGKYAVLVTFLETVLTTVWYASTVATLSRRARDRIEKAYSETVDDDQWWSLPFRLHDFGFRGCTTVEQSVIGGAAHLLSFDGTDTMSAGYYVQFHLNNGKAVASSIPATEHSVMTAHPSEREAILQMIDKFGDGVFACVLDSYDFANALEQVIPAIAKAKVDKGGWMVLRPDSGDQVEVVLMALKAADKVFGSDTNKKGYRTVRGASVIQGDGVTIASLVKILEAAKNAGYAANNIAFGMGGGLLQKHNRDTMSFATKLSQIVYADGTVRDVMKVPKTDTAKNSLPGEFTVRRDARGVPITYPKECDAPGENMLRVVYDHGRVPAWDDFDTVRKRLADEWPKLPRTADNISAPLKEKIQQFIVDYKSRIEMQTGRPN